MIFNKYMIIYLSQFFYIMAIYLLIYHKILITYQMLKIFRSMFTSLNRENIIFNSLKSLQPIFTIIKKYDFYFNNKCKTIIKNIPKSIKDLNIIDNKLIYLHTFDKSQIYTSNGELIWSQDGYDPFFLALPDNKILTKYLYIIDYKHNTREKFEGPQGPIFYAIVHSDKRLIMSSIGNIISVWKDYKLQFTLQEDKPIYFLTITSQGKLLTRTSDHKMSIWNLDTHIRERRYSHYSIYNLIPNEKDALQNVHYSELWPYENYDYTPLYWQKFIITHIAFFNGKVIMGCEDGFVRIYNPQILKIETTIRMNEPFLHYMGVFPNGDILSYGSDINIVIWDGKKRVIKNDRYSTVKVLPNGNVALIGESFQICS